MKISIAGLGYVGLSNAIFFSNQAEIIGFDISKDKIKLINDGLSSIPGEKDFEKYFNENAPKITATNEISVAAEADFFLVCLPTDFKDDNSEMDTSSIQHLVKQVLKHNPDARVVIKSTVPIGFTAELNQSNSPKNEIIFCPEFLREGKSVKDIFNPDRIIIGCSEVSKNSKDFGNLISKILGKKKSKPIFVSQDEAEAIKLFSNTFLAMRVAFFNELDSFAIYRNLNAKNIIDGLSLDQRIGNFYNNPSFGYGGYCLPKDSKQLESDYSDINQKLISSIVESNETRIDFILSRVLKNNPTSVGIYRLSSKKDSPNFRDSASYNLAQKLYDQGIIVLVYEPLISGQEYKAIKIENNINRFKDNSDIILANRMDTKLSDVEEKVFCRDIYNLD